MFSDCHVHLASYHPQEIPDIVQRAVDAGVGFIITAGTTLESSRICVALAQSHASVYASVGIHPMQLRGPIEEETYEALRHLANESPKVVAMSETGMDYLPGGPDLEWQEQAFRQQVRLAHALGLPIIWHSRIPEGDADDGHLETLRIILEEAAGTVGGVMHYFQATEATAWAAIRAGFYISFAKPLLRLPHLWEVAARLPLEHLVLETDASPQPWKPKREEWTEPRDIPQIASKLAALKHLSLEEVAEVTNANLMRMLRLPPQPQP